jgi:hypothetical protein
MFTSGRPRLASLHAAMLVYGVIIEILGFWCPLSALEEWLHVRGGVSAYRQQSEISGGKPCYQQ